MSRYLVMVLVVGMLAGCGAAPTEVEVLEPGGMWDMKDDCVLGGFEAVVEAHTEAILLGDKCLNVEYGVEYYRVALVDDGREGWISGAILSSRNEPLVPLTATVAPTAPPTTPLIVTACMDQCIDLLTLNLDGAIPHDYELELAFSPGQEVGVRCVDGQTEERWVYVNTASHYWDNIACWHFYSRPGGGRSMAWPPVYLHCHRDLG